MEWQPAPIRRRGIDQEQQLLEAARTLRDGWYVAHVHLSRISSVKRNENVVFALQMFEQAIRGIQGRLYVLRNGDWVYVYAGGHGAQVASAVSRLRQLFAGDPLYYNEEKYEADFATWYDLGHDRETFLAVARNWRGSTTRRRSRRVPARSRRCGPHRRRPWCRRAFRSSAASPPWSTRSSG